MNSSYMQFLNIGTVYCKITQKCLQIFTKIFGKTPAVSAILGCHTNKTLCEIQEGLMSCSPSIYSGLLFCIQPHSSFSKSKFYFLTSHKAAGCHVRPHSSPMLCSFFSFFSNIIQLLLSVRLYMPVCPQRYVLQSPIQCKPAAIV